MDKFQRVSPQLLRSRYMPWLGIALTLLTLGATIYWGTMRLRQKIRTQISGRDAAIMHSVALMQQLSQESDEELGGRLEDVADQFANLLHISQLKGVIAARLFDGNRQFYAPFPANVRDAQLRAEDVERLQELKPVSRFHAQANPAALFVTSSSLPSNAPLLEVLIPLHRKDQTKLLGVIQFVIDGASIAAEYAALDRSLFFQAGIAFVVGGLLIVVGLSWAFRQIQRSSSLLLESNQHLAKANEELALVAKTSAVGAVSAHLIHGLSNPLSGLQDFVANRGRGNNESEWQDAMTTASQMQNLIGEIVRIIGDEHGDERYEVPLDELVQMLALKVKCMADVSGVRFETSLTGTAVLPNREANLTLLILENLVKNALQATPSGKLVRCRAAVSDHHIAFEVEDEGSGIPASLRERLFQPCRSTKAGGNGIGLAICKQLANHLGAQLKLKETKAPGCVFALTLLHPKPAVASGLPLR